MSTTPQDGKVEFFLSCSDLVPPNTFIVGFLKDAGDFNAKWTEIGRTEISWNGNPKYGDQFVMDFRFEQEQQLRFDVYKSVNGNKQLISKNVIGSATFKLSEVIHSKSMY